MGPNGWRSVTVNSDYAQSTLSDVVYVELPEVGDKVSKGEQLGVVESVKAAGDITRRPVARLWQSTKALRMPLELVNQDPFGAGWLVRIKLDDPAELDDLMDAATYKSLVESNGFLAQRFINQRARVGGLSGTSTVTGITPALLA